MPGEPRIDVPTDAIADFCRRWKIVEFALFGSVLREDFGPESDVDVLVTFAADAPWSYFELFDMQDELEALFGRRVDLVTSPSLKNPIRRAAILGSRRVLHAA
ncbi:MAG: nucleotidyltransferase family protein [Phycisphaerales bacterium]|nr:nucleotidyltransferase family protein [Phycisphaerales bacterium]MCB9840311.1 nucleotidyltransferase family protein [Phycisphaeraceae bacterium]